MVPQRLNSEAQYLTLDGNSRKLDGRLLMIGLSQSIGIALIDWELGRHQLASTLIAL